MTTSAAGFLKNAVEECLTELQSNQKKALTSRKSANVRDMVLLHENPQPRQTRKIGVIENLFPGQDGTIRCCGARLFSGNVVHRPVQVLHRLEADVSRAYKELCSLWWGI